MSSDKYQGSDSSPIFTPGNEPYLGLQEVHHFDLVLVEFINHQREIAEWTHGNPHNAIQEAAGQLVPSASAIALSIRELVRQGYLLSAFVLVRPLWERVATLSYLMTNPDTVSLWNAGWPHRTRPSLRARIDAMGVGDEWSSSGPLSESLKKMVDRTNSVVHGDPNGALEGAILLPDGSAGYAISKDLKSPARAAEICLFADALLVILTGRSAIFFPTVPFGGFPD